MDSYNKYEWIFINTRLVTYHYLSKSITKEFTGLYILYIYDLIITTIIIIVIIIT